jgi:tRNA (cytidine/uridine-2'-O-)-methyltransferase
MPLSIVLVHPEIPPNTGNVIRLAANTGATLNLVEPLGFSLEDSHMRRAGLDYREYANVKIHASWEACYRALLEKPFSEGEQRPAIYAMTRYAKNSLYQTKFATNDIFVFGCETHGLPDEVYVDIPEERRLRIPMMPAIRCLNLSNSVAVTVYEAWRQLGFAGAE